MSIILMIDEEELLSKFPAYIKSRIKQNIFSFPSDIQWVYTPIKAYRSVVRKSNDSHPICKSDMLSKFEMYGNSPKRARGFRWDESNPLLYGVSLFEDKNALKNVRNMQPPNTIAVGMITQNGGPCERGESTHVCWWLYEDVDLSCFKIDKEG